MATLPVQGGAAPWGTNLNAWLLTAHNSDGTYKTGEIITIPLTVLVGTTYGPRLPIAMTATAIYAKCVGGTSATVNVLHAAAPGGYLMGTDLVATAGGGWATGTLSVTALSAGDSIDGVVIALSGTPTDVLVQLQLRPT